MQTLIELNREALNLPAAVCDLATERTVPRDGTRYNTQQQQSTKLN